MKSKTVKTLALVCAAAFLLATSGDALARSKKKAQEKGPIVTILTLPFTIIAGVVTGVSGGAKKAAKSKK